MKREFHGRTWSMVVMRCAGLLMMMLAVAVDPTSAIAQTGWHVHSQYSIAPPAAYATVPRGSTVRDAQGEYDDLERSSSIRRLAHLVGLPSQTVFQLCSSFNFFLMLALLYWAGWPKLAAALQTRSRLIKRAIEEAEQFRMEALKRLAEIERHWARLDSEFASMQRVSAAELKSEERALHAKTADDTRRILENAELEIKVAAQRARRDLKAFAADLAVSIARQSIRVDETTDRALVRALVKGLEQSGELRETNTEASYETIRG